MSPTRSGGADTSPSHNAFLALHGQAGTWERGLVSSGDLSAAEALRVLSDADDVTDSARLDVLGALAKADFPDYSDATAEYLALATKVGAAHGLSGEQVLTDLKTEAREPGTIHESETGRSLPHHVVAFYGRDVCNTARIEVGPLPGTWIFSEFETDASFEDVAAWVNPYNWPERSPMMFKSMKPVGGEPTAIPGLEDGTHWHGVFHEVVQLVEQLNTLLHCDYIEIPGTFAGVSYQLTESLDQQINLDRGFLLVNELGATRHVKALKVVGFTTSFWDEVATWVCPVWTDFVRGAVRGGTSSRPLPPQRPPSGSAPADIAASWMRFLSGATERYTEMGFDWVQRASAPGYKSDDLVRDSARYWLALARDWSTATMMSYQALQQLAGETALPPVPGASAVPFIPTAPAATPQAATGVAAGSLDNQVFVPGAGGLEGTTLPVTDLAEGEPISCSSLVRLGTRRDVIEPAAITVRNEKIAEGVYGAKIEVAAAEQMAGLYIGTIEIGPPGKTRSQPIQLYISRAKEATPGGG